MPQGIIGQFLSRGRFEQCDSRRAYFLIFLCRGQKGVKSKKLLIFTNLDGLCNADELARIAKRLKKAEIELLLVGPDLPDAEDDEDGAAAPNGSADSDEEEEGKPKSENQLRNERAMAELIQALDGESWSFE